MAPNMPPPLSPHRYTQVFKYLILMIYICRGLASFFLPTETDDGGQEKDLAGPYILTYV